MTAPDNSDSVLEQQRLIQEITALIPTEVEHDWVQLELRVRCTSPYAEYELDSLGPDGQVHAEMPPSGFTRKLDNLRALMYEEGRGTWLSCRWMLTKNTETGSVDLVTHYNFDEEIIFDSKVSHANFVGDLNKFPRDEQHTPLWLRYALKKGHEFLDAPWA